MYMYFPPLSLENKLYGIHQTSFLPVAALELSELKTPLVYIFPSEDRVGGSQCLRDTAWPLTVSHVFRRACLHLENHTTSVLPTPLERWARDGTVSV